MTMWILLFCIIYISTCLCSSSQSREKKDYKKDKRDDILTDLLEYIVAQKNEIDDLQYALKHTLKLVTGLQTQIDTLKMDLGGASIIPPNLALKFAICRGRLPGISSGNPGDDLRCPSQSIGLLGPNGENDILGTGLVHPISGLPDIEACEAACLDDDRCFAFNWFYQFQGNDRCELYGDQDGLAPSNAFTNTDDNPLIFCRIEPLCNIGDIIIITGSDIPEGYVLADGSAISRDDYPALCENLGITEGSECDLPDLRGKFVIGAGDGRSSSDCKGINAPPGQCGGDDTLDIY